MNDAVTYVKTHIESDVEHNQRIARRNYSKELGEVLQWYLSHASEEQKLLMGGMFAVGELEQRLRSETGKQVHFHEIKKCSSVIYQMWKDADVAGFMELQKYADVLRGKSA